MGNVNCVAGGGCPHQVDILMVNNTEIPLELDEEQDCTRDCHHKGWQVAAGKIVEGREPPKQVEPFGECRFSVSGREGTAGAPNGKVYYINKEVDLHVSFSWACAGWTAVGCSNSAAVVISGRQEATDGHMSIFRRDPKPWAELVAFDVDTDNWIVTIRPRESGDDWKKMIKTIAGGKITLAKAH